ncbi:MULTISPECIES: MFS transporter [unclassified Sporolactobacillus]|uniref:MFS transporter n=1 Tax=unclassified Sporolactobacillus TaxID=2628533 RepID=UPI0023681B4F|nr:MFS transporter [Sporolactobacillus sp. CQH2019]MDD9147788.1 MFS transporter [Sporolactobacillus sp. CQH2019]
MERPGLLNKDFLIDTIANFFIYIVFYLLLVIIAPYAMDTLHATPSEAGLASSIFIVGSLIARIFTGRLIERVGRGKILFIGLIFFLLTTLLYFGVTSLAFLYFVRILHGIGFGISATSAQTFIADIVPKERRGEGIGYFIAFSSTIASAIGPLAGMYLNQRGHFNMIIVICFLVIAISGIAMLFLKIPEVNVSREQLADMRKFKLGNFFEIKAFPISGISLFVGICYASIVSFIDPFARQSGLAAAGNFFFAVYAIFLLLSRPAAGKLFDQRGENSVMYPCFILFAIGLSIISLAHQSAVLLLAAAFVGCGFGTFLSSAQTIAVKVALPHRTGVATSTFYSILEGGMGIGPYFLGLLVPSIGYRGLYICMALVVLACIVPYFFLYGKSPEKADLHS